MRTETSKNIFLFLVTLGTLIVLLVITFEFLARAQAKRYPNMQAIEFYRTYKDQLHHLRDPSPGRWKLNENPRNALYTIVRNYSSEQKTNILIQGDSWAEQFVDSPQTFQYLSSLAVDLSMGLVVAGVSSYAPSPMTMQLRILREDFQINPNKVIAVVDQTDLGDEICRYQPRRSLNTQNKLIAITPEPIGSSETYSLVEFFEHSKIWSADKLGIFKYMDRIKYGFSTRNRIKLPQHCAWSFRKKFLEGDLTHDEESIFISNLLGYIDEVFSDDGMQTLFFVTHPHRNHVFPESPSHLYQNDVSTLIKKTVMESQWRSSIQLIDFHKDFQRHYPNWEENKVFREGDKASHLTNQAFDTVYTIYIFSQIMRDLQGPSIQNH